jgi:hypothetical protein
MALGAATAFGSSTVHCNDHAGIWLLKTACALWPLLLLLLLPADGRYQGFNHPVVLSCAGLLSAAVSTYKYWGT